MAKVIMVFYALVASTFTFQATASAEATACVQVRHPLKAVAGLPLPVQFVVHGPAQVVACSLFTEANSFDEELLSKDRAYRFNVKRSKRLMDIKHYNGPAPGKFRWFHFYRLEEGDTVELLSDLTLLERLGRPRADLAAGKYTFRATARGLEFQPAHSTITLEEPNAEEQRFLKNVRAAHERLLKQSGLIGLPDDNKWTVFIKCSDQILADIDVAKFSECGRRQLWYHLILAELVSSDKPLSELRIPAAPDELFVAYQTEVLLLEHELSVARGDQKGMEEKRDLILARRPEARELLDCMLKTGKGRIARFRNEMQKFKRGRKD